jgi:hypothetical protein
MEAERRERKPVEIIQGKPVEEVLRRAVRHALLAHKRAGNSVAAWKDGRVVLIPSDEIRVEEDEGGRG